MNRHLITQHQHPTSHPASLSSSSSWPGAPATYRNALPPEQYAQNEKQICRTYLYTITYRIRSDEKINEHGARLVEHLALAKAELGEDGLVGRALLHGRADLVKVLCGGQLVVTVWVQQPKVAVQLAPVVARQFRSDAVQRNVQRAAVRLCRGRACHAKSSAISFCQSSGATLHRGIPKVAVCLSAGMIGNNFGSLISRVLCMINSVKEMCAVLLEIPRWSLVQRGANACGNNAVYTNT